MSIRNTAIIATTAIASFTAGLVTYHVWQKRRTAKFVKMMSEMHSDVSTETSDPTPSEPTSEAQPEAPAQPEPTSLDTEEVKVRPTPSSTVSKETTKAKQTLEEFVHNVNNSASVQVITGLFEDLKAGEMNVHATLPDGPHVVEPEVRLRSYFPKEVKEETEVKVSMNVGQSKEPTDAVKPARVKVPTTLKTRERKKPRKVIEKGPMHYDDIIKFVLHVEKGKIIYIDRSYRDHGDGVIQVRCQRKENDGPRPSDQILLTLNQETLEWTTKAIRRSRYMTTLNKHGYKYIESVNWPYRR